MIQIKKETVIKTFRDNNILIETIKQFHYTTEEEKMEHKKIMEANGYRDSGQVRDNIGTVMKPNYVFFGSYFKYQVYTEEVKVYTECLNADGRGDLVRCSDCGELMLIQLGGTACGECESENLQWYDENRPEWTIEELKEKGFIIIEK